MKKQIILLIAFFTSFTSCKQAHSNRDNITKTEEKVDTLSNDVRYKDTVKKNIIILLDSTIEVRNDTLYLSYKVINNTSKNLLFFHIRSLGIILKDHYPELESIYSGCVVHIINSDNELPGFLRSSMGGHREEDPDNLPYSYMLLRAGESKLTRKKIAIGDYYVIGKRFEIKLIYSSPYNEIFINKFKRMQRKNPQLKEYERFEGIIESNLCPLTLPQKKVSIDSILIYIKD